MMHLLQFTQQYTYMIIWWYKCCEGAEISCKHCLTCKPCCSLSSPCTSYSHSSQAQPFADPAATSSTTLGRSCTDSRASAMQQYFWARLAKQCLLHQQLTAACWSWLLHNTIIFNDNNLDITGKLTSASNKGQGWWFPAGHSYTLWSLLAGSLDCNGHNNTALRLTAQQAGQYNSALSVGCHPPSENHTISGRVLSVYMHSQNKFTHYHKPVVQSI